MDRRIAPVSLGVLVGLRAQKLESDGDLINHFDDPSGGPWTAPVILSRS